MANILQEGFRKLMRYAQNLAEYEQGIAEGIIDENVFVIVLDEKVAKFRGQTFDWSGGGSGNGGDFEVRTVYPTKQTVFEEETFDITEEERAYNMETLSKTLSGKTVFCKVGEAILFPTISMSGAVTEATYSTVVVLVGSLASYSLTITSDGDAEVVIADVTTGGGGSSLFRTIYLGGAEELSEEQKQYNIETRTLAIANPGYVNVMVGGLVGTTSGDENTVEVLIMGAFFEYLVCNLLVILEDGTTEYIEQYIYPKVCSLQNSYGAESFFGSKVSPIPETKGVMNGEDGAQYEVDAYNLESRFVEYNKGDKRYRVMFDESYTIIEEIDITPTGSGGGGSIDPALLEGYMPMMREFSDDFNNDFSR